MNITVILNTYNEAALLQKCLESLQGRVDEIIVTDMKSMDGSKSIAESFGCKVVDIDPVPMVESTILQKILIARNNWIMALDPDMVVPPTTWDKIESVVRSDKFDVIVFFVRNKLLGSWLNYGHGSQCVSYRLFRKDFFLRNGNPQSEIHGFFVNNLKDGRKCFLKKRYYIDHYAYSDVTKLLEQHLRYAKIEANELIGRGISSSLWRAFYKSLKKFVGDLIVRRGILDGKEGIVYSATVAMMILQRELMIIYQKEPGNGM